MTSFGVKRWRDWESGQFKPLKPVTHCVRNDLPDSSWVGGQLEYWVEEQIRRIHPGFEIIFDRFTAAGNGPGHHLYRRKWLGPPCGSDPLVLEFSLQWDMDMEWPKGRPRPPGSWIIDEIKKRDKARMVGDELHIDEQLVREAREEAAAVQGRKDKELDESMAEEDAYMAKMGVRAMNKECFPNTNPRRRRGPKSRKVTSYR